MSVRDQRDRCLKRPEIITVWTLGRRERRKSWLAGMGGNLVRRRQRPLLVRMVVRVAIQLFQVFAGKFILWIDFEGAFKVQPRVF
jgi:hypothetical protein